ncbi:hypothetical protein ES703_108611 [subsurface metagenome]
MSHVPRNPGKEARSLPVMRHGARAGNRNAWHDRGIHLPHAPGGGAAGAGAVSHLRHGPGAPHRYQGRGGQPRTGGHAPPLLGECGPNGSDPSYSYVGDVSRQHPFPGSVGQGGQLGPAGAGYAGSNVGRPALFSARVGVNNPPKVEYVHPYCPGHRSGVCLQRCCHAFSGDFPGSLPAWR